MTEQDLEPVAWAEYAGDYLIGLSTHEYEPHIGKKVPLVRADQLKERIRERIEELEEAMEIIQEKFDMPHGEARLNRTIKELEDLLSELDLEE